MKMKSICVLGIISLFGHEELNREQDWVSNAIDELLSLKMIEITNIGIGITQKGEAYLKMVKEVPMPMSKYVDPRE